jgi:hypothetical protein
LRLERKIPQRHDSVEERKVCKMCIFKES